MKHICLNLKRFDVPVAYGGVNRLADIRDWGAAVVSQTQEGLKKYEPEEAEFLQFLPEAHLLSATAALCENSPVQIGSQGVYRMNTAPGGNFGAFTTNRPASAVKALGCTATLIGHCEERVDKKGILAEAGVTDADAVNRLLNMEIKCAQEAGLKVVYCIGETEEEQPQRDAVLGAQLDTGLKGTDTSGIIIAYEPVWSIGPGKTPAGKDYITEVARFVKERTGGLPVIYGGGLKTDNAQMLASIGEIDGGLIALTRFQGEIGFYPEEYLEIIRLYLGKE
ncbi:MAG: triosephosphate isomerase [Lachnospiraceae bacterium]|nr:triosephosphate isomerase [Lachnospiraceae bacterium]